MRLKEKKLAEEVVAVTVGAKAAQVRHSCSLFWTTLKTHPTVSAGSGCGRETESESTHT